MKACAEPRVRSRLLALAAAVLLLPGCAMLKGGADDAAPAEPTPQARPVDKGDPEKRFAEALALHKSNPAQAEKAWAALTRDFPTFSGPWTNLGILYAKSNRKAEAISALARATSINPDNHVAFNWLGIAYREAGDLARARGAYERALAIKPDYALAHYNLAVLLDAHARRPLEALPHYQEYQRLAGKQDLKVIAWVAEIEAARRADPQAAPAGAPLAPVAPAGAAPQAAPNRDAPADPAAKKSRLSTFETGEEKAP